MAYYQGKGDMNKQCPSISNFTDALTASDGGVAGTFATVCGSCQITTRALTGIVHNHKCPTIPFDVLRLGRKTHMP